MKMKTKGYAAGGKMKTKGYAAGGKMKMVMKDGKKIPAFAADGAGKMKAGGAVKKAMGSSMMKTKGYAAGGKMKTKKVAKKAKKK
jgi:hypothetical protein